MIEHMPNFIITTTKPCHAQQIHDIEVATFPDPWPQNAILQEINDPKSICLVALQVEETATPTPVCNNALPPHTCNKCIKESIVLGHVTMRKIFDEGHINNIAVCPKHRRNGVGAMLMEALLSKAQQHNITGVTLEVRVSNTAAILLYQKYGFTIVGYRKNYYSAPQEDGAVMWNTAL